MGVQVEWFDSNQRIIVFTFKGKWKWSELFQAIERCHRMIDEVNYPVRTVFDLSHMIGWVENPLANMKKANKFYHPRSSTVAVVGLSNMLKSIVVLFQRFVGFSNKSGVYFFDTLLEAVDFLSEEVKDEVAI